MVVAAALAVGIVSVFCGGVFVLVLGGVVVAAALAVGIMPVLGGVLVLVLGGVVMAAALAVGMFRSRACECQGTQGQKGIFHG